MTYSRKCADVVAIDRGNIEQLRGGREFDPTIYWRGLGQSRSTPRYNVQPADPQYREPGVEQDRVLDSLGQKTMTPKMNRMHLGPIASPLPDGHLA